MTTNINDGTRMKLKDELLEIAGHAIGQHFDRTKGELAEMLRKASREGRGWLFIETRTLEGERALVRWCAEEDLKADAMNYALGSRGVMIAWGYEPAVFAGEDATLLPDGSLRVKPTQSP